jgi:hypothetical protein
VEEGFEEVLQILLPLCFCGQNKFFAALTAVIRIDAIFCSATLTNIYFIQ